MISYRMRLYGKLEVLKYLIEERGMIEYMEYFGDILEELLKLNPPDKNLLIFASRFYAYDANDFDRAAELAERVVKLYPSWETMRNYDRILYIRDFARD